MHNGEVVSVVLRRVWSAGRKSASWLSAVAAAAWRCSKVGLEKNSWRTECSMMSGR